jgi:hypothetical protein
MNRFNTIRERLLQTLRGEDPDRVPLQLDGFLYNEVGYPLEYEDGYSTRCHPPQHPGDRYLYNTSSDIEQEQDPLKREIMHRALEHSHIILTWPSYHNRYLVTPPQFIEEQTSWMDDNTLEITSVIHTPKGELTARTYQNEYTIWTDSYPVNSFEEIEKIRSINWELPPLLEPPHLESMPEDYDQRYILETRVSSPFVCVAGMMPYQYFLELCATDLDLLKELTAVCEERELALLDVLLKKQNIDIVWMGGCEWVTPPMASETIYEELVQPYEQRIIEKAHQGGALVHVHCHGNIATTLERIIARGGDFTEPVEPPPDGDITMHEAKQITDGRIALGGNIESRILSNESADDVKRAVEEAFAGGGDRMVLMPTAYPIDRFTKRMQENYHALIDTWEQLS